MRLSSKLKICYAFIHCKVKNILLRYLFLLQQSMLDILENCGKPSLLHCIEPDKNNFVKCFGIEKVPYTAIETTKVLSTFHKKSKQQRQKCLTSSLLKIISSMLVSCITLSSSYSSKNTYKSGQRFIATITKVCIIYCRLMSSSSFSF